MPSAGISDSSRLRCDNKGISSFLSMTYGKSLGSFVLAKLQVVGQEIQPHKHNYCIIFYYQKPVHWGLQGHLHRASWPRFFEICRRDSFWAVPGAALPRSVGKTAVALPCLPLLTDALIDLKVRHRLGRFIPVWGWLDGFTGLRITVIPQR